MRSCRPAKSVIAGNWRPAFVLHPLGVHALLVLEYSAQHAGPMGGSHSVWYACNLALNLGAPVYRTIRTGLVTVMFGATGTLFNTSKRLQNQGKVCPEYSVSMVLNTIERMRLLR